MKLPSNVNYLSLSNEDKSNLALYIALMFYRGPSFREGIKQIYKKIAERATDILLSKKLTPELPCEFDSRFLDLYRIKISEEVSLEPMINNTICLAKCLLGKYWQFNFCESYSFITRDTPVVMDNKYSNEFNRPGPHHPFTEFMFPLRNDLCLVCTYQNPIREKNDLIFKADQDFVNKCNKGIVRAANREIYASMYDETLTNLSLKIKTISKELRLYDKFYYWNRSRLNLFMSSFC